MTYLANNDARFCFNYVIASAQETCATVGDYMDYLLDQTSTRVIAIFLEAVRDVPAFIAALQKARDRDIPVVITRLGRTEKSARLAAGHSGAIVGDHDVFVAACQRYNAILCNDADEMIVTAMLFGAGYRVARGNLASMLDSGRMREQMIDLAEDHAVTFARISANTEAVLKDNLETGLEPVNPEVTRRDTRASAGRSCCPCRFDRKIFRINLRLYRFDFRNRPESDNRESLRLYYCRRPCSTTIKNDNVRGPLKYSSLNSQELTVFYNLFRRRNEHSM